MKNIKKRKILIIVIVLVMVSLCFILFLQYSISKSILGETKVKYIVDINKVQEVQLAQQDFTAEKMLSKRDKLRLFQILCSTRKYNKKKDKSYLLDGYFLFLVFPFNFWYNKYVIEQKYGCDFPIVDCPLVLRKRG